MVHPIKIKNMTDLARHEAELREKPILTYLFFELTDMCNLRCQHCGSQCERENSTFLDFRMIEKTLHRVADRYTPSDIMICLTGGEPLLHPAIYDVIRTAHDLGFSVGITTNGTLINTKAARKLAHAGLDTVAVSVDGIGEIHDEFRATKGSFEKALSGIRALKEAYVEPQIITVVHRKNFYQLEELYDLCVKMDIYSWRLVNIDPIGRARVHEDLLLGPQQMKDLLEYIRGKRFDNAVEMDVTYGCSHFVTLEYENEIRDYYFQCIAGTRTASIMANGNIGACLDIERRDDLVQGNIYQDDFVDVWENRFKVFRRNRADISKTCSQCENREFCQGDSAHTWDYDNKEPRYCVSRMLKEVSA